MTISSTSTEFSKNKALTGAVTLGAFAAITLITAIKLPEDSARNVSFSIISSLVAFLTALYISKRKMRLAKYVEELDDNEAIYVDKNSRAGYAVIFI